MRFVVVQLRTLIGIGDVFKQQRMEPELLPECFQHLHFMDAADVHPNDGLVRGRSEGIRPVDRLFIAPVTGVVKGRHRDLVRLLFADVDKRAGRESGFLRSFLDQFHRHGPQPLLVRRFPQGVKGERASALDGTAFPEAADLLP